MCVVSAMCKDEYIKPIWVSMSEQDSPSALRLGIHPEQAESWTVYFKCSYSLAPSWKLIFQQYWICGLFD